MKHRISLYREVLLGLLFMFPFLKFNYVSILTIIFSVLTVVDFFLNIEKFTLKDFKLKLFFFLTASSFITILSLTVPYSSNSKEGLNILQNGLGIFIFPLILLLFYRGNISKKLIDRCMCIFTISNFIVCIQFYFMVCNLNVDIINVSFWDNPYRNILFNMNIHPSYFAMWVLLNVLILFSNLFTTKRNFYKIIFVFLISMFLITVILLAARGPIIAFIISFIFYIIFSVKNRLQSLVMFLGLFFITVCTLLFVPSIKSRFINEFEAQSLKPPVGLTHTSSNIRSGIYLCSYKIFRENKLFGVGVGDVQDELSKCYSNFHTRVYDSKEYNSHSTYINVLLSGGLIILVIFLLSFVFQFTFMIKHKDYLYGSFLFLIMFSILFENVFSRMHGAVFYGLFNALFLKLLIYKINK